MQKFKLKPFFIQKTVMRGEDNLFYLCFQQNQELKCLPISYNLGGTDTSEVYQLFSACNCLNYKLMQMRYLFISFLLLASLTVQAFKAEVRVLQRDPSPLLSYLVVNNSIYKQVFNPTWIQASPGTNNRAGLLARTQDCDYQQNKCIFCGGSASKASILTYSQQKDGVFTPITEKSISFTPSSFEDSWGTEDPRMVYFEKEQRHYMMYTAYNGSSILLSLARSRNPFDRNSWERLGPVFPSYQNSKSGAILIRNEGDHYLFWGDSDIRIARSSAIDHWPSIGEIFLSPRADKFDSRLVQSGPPPLLLKNGNYLFFYNSAQKGWPEDPKTAYHVGWVILDGKQPSKILARSQQPLMGPQYNWQKGESPYLCNVPNVVFLEAAYPLGGDKFKVFFGAGDAVIGSAIVQVTQSQQLSVQRS